MSTGHEDASPGTSHLDTQTERIVHDAITGVRRLIDDGAPPGAVFDSLLARFLEVTQSEYGFIGDVLVGPEGRPYLKTHAITNIAWNDETCAFYDEHAPHGLEFYNLRSLFGAVITSTRPVIANEPGTDSSAAGLPEGHPAMHAFLGVPLVDAEGMVGMLGVANRPAGYDMVGMLGVANRPAGYDEELLELIEPLTATTARLLREYRALREAR